MNKPQFYQTFPNFDWNFYTSNYQDLNHLNNEDKAINHYWNNGQHESRRTHTIIENNKQPTIFIDPKDILCISKQCHVSKGLHMFQTRLFEKFNLTSYSNQKLPCIFFGIYTDDDLIKIRDHHGLKLIIWGGEDANPSNTHSLATMNEIKRVPNAVHLSISECIYNRLLTQNIQSVLINFNLVDTTLFKPLKNNELGNEIFIFNGQNKGHGNWVLRGRGSELSKSNRMLEEHSQLLATRNDNRRSTMGLNQTACLKNTRNNSQHVNDN